MKLDKNFLVAVNYTVDNSLVISISIEDKMLVKTFDVKKKLSNRKVKKLIKKIYLELMEEMKDD